MGKNRKQASLTNVVQYDSNFNLSIGSSASSSFNSSGSIVAASGFTGSLSGSVFGLGNTVSFSSSVSSRLTNIETKSASVDISISNINTITSSFAPRVSNLETKSASVDISITNINSFTASNANQSLNSKTGSYATTGSNTFFGTQTYSGSVYIANDLVVQGSSSIQYISASSVSIGTNIVQLNTANPSVRFAGLTMIDSGSIGGSGSFLYDSVEDEFIFVHRGNGTNVTSSHFIMGPETFDNLGNETYLTCNILTKGTGKEHLVNSCIFDNGTTVCINSTLKASGQVCGIMGTFSCIGINCSTPSYNLDVNGCGRFSNTLKVQHPSLWGSIEIVGSAANQGGQVDFYGGTTRYATITGEQESTDNGRLIYRTLKSNTLTTALTISSTGVATFAGAVCGLGFYASSLQSGITIDSTTNGDTIIASRGLSSSLHGIVRTVGQNGVACMQIISTRNSVDGNLPASVNAVWGLTNSDMVIATCNTERMRITNRGFVGINNTNPTTLFNITMAPTATSKTSITSFGTCGLLYLSGLQGTTNSEIGFFAGNDYSSLSAGMGIARANSGNWNTQLRFYTHVSSTGGSPDDISEKMRIDGDGVVRIGTCAINWNTNSTVALQVAGAIRFGNPDGEYTPSYGGGISARTLSTFAPGSFAIIVKGLGGSGFLYQIQGFTLAGVRFTDLVFGVNNTFSVIASQNENGPAARCYTITSENLNICIGGSATYSAIVAHGFGAVER